MHICMVGAAAANRRSHFGKDRREMTASGKLVWRVRAQDEMARTSVFDAALLPPDAWSWEPIRLFGLDVPYASERPDGPMTLVVRARTGSCRIVVECEAYDGNGTRLVYGRSTNSEAVIIRMPTGIRVTTLPPGEPDPFAPLR
jgi:hypothetical protein